MSSEVLKAAAEVSGASGEGEVPKFDSPKSVDGTDETSDSGGDENIPEFENNDVSDAEEKGTSDDSAESEESTGASGEHENAEDRADTADPKESSEGLTDEQRRQIKEETGWSDEILDHIENMDQYEIYKNADLEEREVNGRKCLCKKIDMDYVDPKTGLTNRERISRRPPLVPIDSKTGERIELHHMGQDANGPFAELCENSEHGDGNHKVLHPKSEGSWRGDKEKVTAFEQEKREHWAERAQEGNS